MKPQTIPEMSRDQATHLMQSVMNRALDQAFGGHDRTVAAGDQASIATFLPEKLPRKGMGPEYLAELLTGPLTDHIRDYRHPLHFGHQRPAPLVASWAGDLLAGSTNSTVSVFEAGPLSVTVENLVGNWVKDLFSLPASARVTQTNGGSESVLTALLCAREQKQRLAQDMDMRRLVVLHSENAHYCVARSARVLGLLRENIRAVATDAAGRMSMAALTAAVDQASAEGMDVMAIVASAGTTANSAFDDLNTCAEQAALCDAWFHVDASHGGSAILSSKLSAKLDGLLRADSFGWNPHKLMWIAPPSSLLIVQNANALKAALSDELCDASYIADQKAINRVGPVDPIEWSLACTRPFAAIKIFSALVAYGSDALGQRVETMCDLAQELARLIDGHPEFELMCHPDFNMVCFRLTGADPDSRLHRHLRDRMARAETAYLTGVEMDGRFWLRAHLISENTTKDDLSTLLEVVLDLGLTEYELPKINHPKKGICHANSSGTGQQRTIGCTLDSV